MTSLPPPTYYFNGIYFNPAFYNPSSSGLTTSTANALYLRKTYADTASSLETFSAGIATNNVNTTTLASNLLIGSSTNTGTITISTINTGNSDSTPAISIGTDSGAKTIKINNSTNSVHLSSLDCTGAGLNNVTPTSGPIYIGNAQTTSTNGLLLGCSTTGNVRTTAPIQIGTDTTMTGGITIGNSSTTSPYGTITKIVGQLVSSFYPQLNTNYTPATNDAGCYFGWNRSGSNGEFDIISMNQGGSGGLGIFGRVSTGPSNEVPLGSILATTLSTVVNGVLNIGSINFPYTTFPTLGSNQLGYVISSYITTAFNLATTGNPATITSITLPIGIWQCSYAVRLINSTALQTTTFTNISINLALPTPITGTPNTYAINIINTTQTTTTVGLSNISMVGSAVIPNSTSELLSLSITGTYTSTGGAPQVYGAAVPQCYLMAVRIA